jgi:uncharacterized protein
MRVSSLWIHPVKSCRAVAVDRVEIDETGLRHDRRWMIVDADGRFVSQRERPELAGVSVTVWGDHVALTADGHGALALPIEAPAHAPARRVTVWNDAVDAVSASPDAASWLLTTLGIEGDIVWMPPERARPVDPAYARASDRVGFADGFPLLLTAQSSLDAINAALPQPVPMERFRPNVVVEGSEAFDEDAWAAIRVGLARCRSVKPCARCVIVNTDPWSGSRSVEPLKTLSRLRQLEGKVYFGHNLVHARESIGRWVSLGDEVVVESRVDPSAARTFDAPGDEA